MILSKTWQCEQKRRFIEYETPYIYEKTFSKERVRCLPRRDMLFLRWLFSYPGFDIHQGCAMITLFSSCSCLHTFLCERSVIWSAVFEINKLMNLKKSGDSTGFEPMTSAMQVQCSNQLSYEVTQLRAGQFVELMFSRERTVVWKKYYMKCRGVRNQLKIWSSHLLDKHRTSISLHLREHFLLTGSEKEKNFKDQRVSKKLEKHKVTKKKKKRNQFNAHTLNPFPWVPSWIGSVAQPHWAKCSKCSTKYL